MGSTYDKTEGYYYLDKDIEIESIHTPVILYIVSKNQRSNKSQQRVFEEIKDEFPKIWINIKSFLVNSEQVITEKQLRKEYRLESLTILIDIERNKKEWEIDLLNLKDGFSRITVEMKGDEPFNFSVEA